MCAYIIVRTFWFVSTFSRQILLTEALNLVYELETDSYFNTIFKDQQTILSQFETVYGQEVYLNAWIAGSPHVVSPRPSCIRCLPVWGRVEGPNAVRAVQRTAVGGVQIVLYTRVVQRTAVGGVQSMLYTWA